MVWTVLRKILMIQIPLDITNLAHPKILISIIRDTKKESKKI
jgi:hypothetical protein